MFLCNKLTGGAVPILLGLLIVYTKKWQILLKFKSILIRKIAVKSSNNGTIKQQECLDHCIITCDVLYEPSTTFGCDIVFIHGLNGSLTKTWRQGLWDVGHTIIKDKQTLVSYNSEKYKSYSLEDLLCRKICNCIPTKEHCCTDFSMNYSHCWPKDWLPIDCPDCRVIAVNYTTDPYLLRPFWIKEQKRSSMHERGLKMMEKLQAIHVGNNPIIWVAHSKGGLFVKQILVHGSSVEKFKNFVKNTKGILFYSVPHFGTQLADLKFPLFRKSMELLEVRKDNPNLIKLHQEFLNVLQMYNQKLPVYSFIETTLTFLSVWYVRIVGIDSADPGLGELFGVPLDHRNICKPINRNCILYKELIKLVNDVETSQNN